MRPLTTAFLPLVAASTLAKSANSVTILQTPVSNNMLFKFDDSCNDTQQNIIRQSAVDATIIAKAGLNLCTDIGISDNVENIPGTDKCIDFDDYLATEYFGSLSHMNHHIRAAIGRIMYGASMIYQDQDRDAGTYQRIITVSCAAEGEVNLCGDNGLAGVFGYNDHMIYYLPFFHDLESTASRIKAVEKDVDGTMRLNVSNLFSQGSLTLHELLHLCPYDTSTGNCPRQACEDWDAYGSDLSRSLARAPLNVKSGMIAHHNDNHVFYALAKFMHKRFGVRPFYYKDKNTNDAYLQYLLGRGHEDGTYKATIGQPGLKKGHDEL